MADAVPENGAGELAHTSELPAEIKDWNKTHVRNWIVSLKDVDDECAQILYDQNITGPSLLLLGKSDLMDINVKLGPAKLIIRERDELIKLKTCQLNTQGNCFGSSCKPYPFNQFHAAYRYKENSILDITETGTLNFIEPCHEYKAFINFHKGARTEKKLNKYINEVIRFSAACMNSRTNGTIHFGVGDAPCYTHGQILGTTVEDKEVFVMKQSNAVEVHFDHKHIDVAKKCIKPPRFIEVLKADMTFSGKYVIEVDIEPSFLLCKDKSFHIYNASKGNSKNTKCKKQADKSGKSFYIRDSSSSRNLYVQNLKDYNKYINNITQLDQKRKEAEEDHLFTVKISVQGSKLCEMLTGGSQSLDKSYFKRYILVTNKLHPVQRESLAFLLDMNFTAVLDFDPESAETGLNKMFEERNTNIHLPMQYKITEPVEEIASKLKLTRTTSWVFCNGGVKEEKPSGMDNWLTEKGASIRDVVSFLCRKDVLPNKKFLVIFMLLSDVTDKHDPLLETFSMFLQELNGTEQILCICENEKSYSYWKELIEARYSTVNISKRSVYELSFAEINGTVLSLWSENRKSSRFLPSVGGKVLLSKKMEGTLDTLSILCVNQCEGGNEDKKQLEESFYKGGKVSWWNFYFSEQPGSVPFIKRDKFDYIINTIIPELCSLKQGCVHFNIHHLPGCGGTTLAMHVLWTLKDKFRCAVLKDKLVNIADVAKQVIDLLVYETSDQQAPLQVLLMIDDVENPEAVNDLQQQIQICLNGMNFSKCYQVILMNCMRDESGLQTEATDDAVFIGNKLSDGERKHFEKKLEEIEQIYKDAETFYGFMILKKDFSSEYIEGVVKNTLKGFNIQKRHAQLFAVLVLLGNYSKRAMVSVSACEEFLKIEPDSGSRKVEDEFGKLSTLLTRCEAMYDMEYDAIRVIHPRMAEHCLVELSESFSVSKAQIIDFLLTTDVFYTCVQGKDELLLNVRNMLLKRRHSVENFPADSRFSPLVQAIINETPTFAENVLFNAAKRFSKDAVMFQLLSRYYYLKKKDFREAKVWAKKAKELQENSSYICDTTAQVIKHDLKEVLHNDIDNPIKADKLIEYLQMAVSATVAFREIQEIARKETEVQYQGKKESRSYNTAGCFGELQVAVMVIEILKRIPVFSDFSCNILSLLLSGKMKIQELVADDVQKHKNASYYHVLQTSQGVTDLLYNLKDNMKKHFDFFDNYFVNLVSFYYTPDHRELKTRQEISRCFQQYVQLFCKPDSRKHKSKAKTESALFLEGRKADSYSGLLEYLYRDNSGPDCALIIEEVIFVYDSILKSSPQNESWRKDAVNFIYANIVLSKIKPQSDILSSYKNLLQYLCKILKCTISLSESMPLYFLSVLMLWPETIPTHSTEQMRESLGSNVSQLRNAFSNKMKPVWNGKRARIHFYLGKKSGYDRLISQKEIDECSKQTMTQCQNERIWRKEKVKNILCRVTGVISTNGIIADTPNKNEKVKVFPLFQSYGNLDDKVSFFIGFTMNGPVALDVQPGL